ncbi:MAG: TrmH family RNA methyltransferase, partial [Spirochaetia bacterium]|nr:TrmH family RNA methyltransferase [Spirochaetia bacterium]
RTRKCALLLERTELDIAELRDTEKALSLALALAEFLASDEESGLQLKTAAGACAAQLTAQSDPELALRSINDFRHYLVRLSGQAPADWDLHDYRAARGKDYGPELASRPGLEGRLGSQAGQGLVKPRSFYPGLRVFLEDIRSPFNVGSILRTAEALGFEEVLLSPACADPGHPRAARSSMGAVEFMPWKRCALEDLPSFGPALALELGGCSVADFAFPSRGVLLLGSEELGLSQPALALAGSKRISIPMKGLKASLNVAVAFGIAAHAWTESCVRF